MKYTLTLYTTETRTSQRTIEIEAADPDQAQTGPSCLTRMSSLSRKAKAFYRQRAWLSILAATNPNGHMAIGMLKIAALMIRRKSWENKDGILLWAKSRSHLQPRPFRLAGL